MTRTDIHYAHEMARPISRSRASTDSDSPSLSKKNSLPSARRISNAEGRWTAPQNDTLLMPHAPLDLDGAAQKLAPSPALSEQSHSPPDTKRRSSRTSSNPTPEIGAIGQSWNQDSHHLMTASDFNTSSDALDYRLQKGRSAKTKVHIKPILRRMSRDDAPSASIDLSRSSTEQDGLGIYWNLDRDRRRSESLTGSTYRRTASGLHHRSTSGTSQFSTGTGSSISKPGSQYVHPMRQMPSAFTPPLGQSYQASAHESDLEDGSPETESSALPGSETQRTPMYASSSGPPPRLSLHLQDDSFTRLPGISQTNIASRPSFGYSRDNGSTLDTASPISRTSLDFGFRSRTRTSTDPISRAAAIQAARQAFEEKEAAKTRRFEKQQIKAEERQTRRREKRHLSPNRDSLAVHSGQEMSEKATQLPLASPPKSHERQPSASWKSQSKSTWMLFVTWLRTRVFKLRRKARKLR
ncbi:hypothetical protein N7474_010534 [Penicillium riverlandense]|uniref:uncharacterized protein n=1 Tax=Penicillium riverlandense TaxID=1903569 RepID=UPI002548C104|nr:uncharacterized protein N7474_010534 [Penicillium riverlandense]KAJ5806942.1 hypothetical protein N7474_010534 [Penicillium riverlandense]